MKHPIHTNRLGFTLLETMVVSVLTSGLVLIIAVSWRGLGQPLSDAVAQTMVTQEASLAAAGLARDFTGSCIDLAGPLQTKHCGKIVSKLIPDPSQIMLCFDNGNPPNGAPDWALPDTVLSYHVEANRLVRTNQSRGTKTTVAKYVESLAVRPVSGGTEFKITFQYQNLKRTYTIVAKDP